MEGNGFPQFCCHLGQDMGILQREDGGANVQLRNGTIGRYCDLAQNQNGFFDPGAAKLQRFGHGRDAEKGAPVFQMPGDDHSTVTVAVALYNSHHRHTCFLPDSVQILADGIQIDIHIGIIEGHGSASSQKIEVVYHKKTQL